MVGEVSPWPPASGAFLIVNENAVRNAPVIRGHTPSLAPVLPWLAEKCPHLALSQKREREKIWSEDFCRFNGWRYGSDNSGYYSVEKDKYYSQYV
jgi:hypothetical protein